MKKKIARLVILCFMGVFVLGGSRILAAQKEKTLANATQFEDISGNKIHAHGGCLIEHNGCYYWYGEHRDSSNLFLGVSCYKSLDLINWEYRGEVLSPDSAQELKRCNIERPKVMYNASTNEFVMWMHWENGSHYGEARAAVAYGKTPDGKFTYLQSFRPMKDTGVTDHGLPGYMSRDCSVFVDSDGKGYFISSSNENMDLHLYELTPDYKDIAFLKAKLFVGQQRESPCLIKRGGYYYLITSGCTGWQPNQAKFAYSRNLENGWSELYNLANSSTYNSQPAFIFPVAGSEGVSYLYTGDQWAGAWGGKVNDSRYVWLPLEFASDTKLELPYYDSIMIDVQKGTIRESLEYSDCFYIVNKNSGKFLDVKDGSVENAARIVQWEGSSSSSQKWYIVDAGEGYKKIVNAKSGKSLDVMNESTDDGGVLIQYTATGGYNQHWRIEDIGGGFCKIISRNSNKLLDVYKWSTDNGGEVQQWGDTNGENQHWRFVPVEEAIPGDGYILGDINGDSCIDSADLILIKRFLLKAISSFPCDKGNKAADVNGDGRIDSSDMSLIKRYILRKIEKFPA
ncbi:MAG: family 43 glycosylhydrolase [Clostridium sp.]|nr:family 43 glycosylhydrolase [Clostridium sp.]